MYLYGEKSDSQYKTQRQKYCSKYLSLIAESWRWPRLTSIVQERNTCVTPFSGLHHSRQNNYTPNWLSNTRGQSFDQDSQFRRFETLTTIGDEMVIKWGIHEKECYKYGDESSKTQTSHETWIQCLTSISNYSWSFIFMTSDSKTRSMPKSILLVKISSQSKSPLLWFYFY